MRLFVAMAECQRKCQGNKAPAYQLSTPSVALKLR